MALLSPGLLFLLVEIVLRIGGYGYSTGFFREIKLEGKDFLIPNENFSLRFFPPELARWPTSFKIEAVKPKDTCRVFVFGESAAMGDPQPAFGASRFMEVLLRERFPKQKFEIINLGITAINSHVILPMARDCAAQHADIWIIYMGNNEMVGPFGAATVFGTRAPPLAVARLNLAFKTTRVGQLVAAGLRKLGAKSKNTSWGGMQMFLRNQIPAHHPRKETVYRNFESNLRDIVDAGTRSGAKVILSTVSVNLRDSPPFASLSNSNLPTEARQQFDKFFAEARAFQSASNYSEASRLFEKAAGLDPDFAEAHYRRGECLWQFTNAAAKEQFQLACDTDALPFRADTRINGAIRRAGSANTNLLFCDAEAALNSSSGGVAGADAFFEHVHFNFTGNYRLGKAWAEAVARCLLASTSAQKAPAWPSQADCEEALGLTDWNRHFVLQSVLRRLGQPPLSSQFNNPERLSSIQAADAELARRQKAPGAADAARAHFQKLVQARPDDPFLHEGFANFCEAIGDPQGAEAQYRRLLEVAPEDFYASLQLGRLLGEQGRAGQGQPFLESAVRLRPTLPEGWHELGIVLAAQAKFTPALDCMRRAEEIRPQDPGNVCYTAKVLAKMNRRQEAIQGYRRAIQMKPDFWEARFELGNELASSDQINDAMHEYAEVIRINPRHATSHINLGVLLVRNNRIEEAIAQFEDALKLEPNNKKAQDYLAQVRSRQSR